MFGVVGVFNVHGVFPLSLVQMVDTVHPFGVGIHISTHKLRKVFCNGGTVAPCHFLQKVFAFNGQLCKWIREMAEINRRSQSYFIELALDKLIELTGGYGDGEA